MIEPYLAALRAYPVSQRIRIHSERVLRRVRGPLLRTNAELPPDVAIVVRGSLTRGDFCPYSDIDLSFVTAAAASLSAQHIGATLTARTGVEVAVHAVPPSFAASTPMWESLFWALHGRFIGGSADTYREFRATAQAVVGALNAATLVAMWLRDERREYLGRVDDPLRTNVKRGLGGILDWDYVNLVCAWARLTRRGQARYLLARQQSRMMFWYLRLLKFHLHTLHRAARETPLDDHIRARSGRTALPGLLAQSTFESIQTEHRGVVEDIHRLLRGE